MNEALLVTVGVAGVCILVAFEVLKWAKAHQSNPLVQQVEAKVPPAVLSAAGIPAVTGEHLVAAVTATGAAVAQAVQAVATVGGVPANQAALFLGQGTVDAAVNRLSAPQPIPEAAAPPAQTPPFPGVWIQDAAKDQTITSQPMILPGGFSYMLWAESPVYFKDFTLSGLGPIAVNGSVTVTADTVCTLSATCYGNPSNPTGQARLQCRLDKHPIKP